MTAPNTETPIEEGDWDALLNDEGDEQDPAAPAATAEAGAQGAPDAPPVAEAPADPAAPDDRPRNPDGTFAPKAGAPAATDGAAVDPSAAVAAAAPPAFAPPDGGKPWKFRADNSDVEIPGALEYEHGVYIPREAWEKHLRPNYIANRESWRTERTQLVDRARRAEQAGTHREARANAILSAMDNLLAQGPDAVADWLADFERNAPILQAQAEAAEARAQLQYHEQERAARAAEEERAQIIPLLAGRLETTVTQALQAPDLALIAETPQERQDLLGQLWSTYGQQLFWEADRDYPEYGIPKGFIGVNEEFLREVLGREAQRVARIRQRFEAAKSATERNAAAVAPAPQAPAPTKPRAATPQQGRQKAAPHARPSWDEFKEQFDADDWSDVLTG